MSKNSNFIRFVLSLYKPVKFLTIVMVISMVISEIFDLIKQYIIKGIIDLPTASNFQISDLYKVIIILLVVIVLELIFFYISNITRTIYMVKQQTPYISEKLFKNLDKKGYPFFVNNFSGKISSSINEINDEIVNLNTLITTGFMSLLTSMISSLIILYTIDINIFITALILFSGIIITRLIYFSQKYLPLIQKSQEANREYIGVLNDSILNFASLRVYGSVENFSKMLKNKKQETNYFRNKASAKEFTYGAIANIVYVITFAILLYYSVNMFSKNLMSLGNLIFFINAMISLKSDTTLFAWSYIHIGEAFVKLKNCYNLLYDDTNLLDDTKESIEVVKGTIKFDNVSFKYTKNYVFQNFDLCIKEKEKVGIIGVSGSGKTTLVNLLFKFYTPQKGKILIDNKDINNYNTKSIYENITYVPQETILLHTTIYENIKIAKPTASYNEIVAAAKKAELHEFIEKLDDKYDTIVGERGIKLSGGQRQRIALARIFLRDSKIVIFDEATSSLDNNTEFKIQQNIHKYFNNQTIICIAHRLSTLKDMDYIVVIDNGIIIDTGSPKVIIPKYEKVDFLKNNDV